MNLFQFFISIYLFHIPMHAYQSHKWFFLADMVGQYCDKENSQIKRLKNYHNLADNVSRILVFNIIFMLGSFSSRDVSLRRELQTKKFNTIGLFRKAMYYS